jgi:hypothetical protein
MECFMEVGWDGDEKGLAIAIVTAETELAALLVSHTLDCGEMGRRDILNNQ